jgi:signal transduction histidine kinase
MGEQWDDQDRDERDQDRKFDAMARRLAELEEIKDAFLEKIGHDLRTPLAAILGHAKVLSAGYQGPLSPEQLKTVEAIVRNGQRLDSLLENILDLAMLERGRMPIKPGLLYLRPCVESVLDAMRQRAEEFEVGLDFSAVPDVRVLADENALWRILANLVSNALKFTPSGGEVFVEWASVDGHDRIAVRDTGVGIPANRFRLLFKKFSQVPETRDLARRGKGTGLGLAICKELAELHGGRVGVESSLGRGSTFYFTLPRSGNVTGASSAALKDR